MPAWCGGGMLSIGEAGGLLLGGVTGTAAAAACRLKTSSFSSSVQ